MPSNHYRHRSPSPSSSDSSGHRHRSRRYDDPPTYERYDKPRRSHTSRASDQSRERPRLNTRPELNRSYSEGTYRENVKRDARGRGRDKPSRRSRSRSSSSDSSRSRSRSNHRRRSRSRSQSRRRDHNSLKPIIEDVLAAFGLVRSKNRHSSSDRRHNDRHNRDGGSRGVNQSAALRAAISAAALEAYRTRHEGFSPQRLLRIAGAAIAAGGLDAIAESDGREGSTRQLIESVIGGMKSSQAFGHRIRRTHGLTARDQVKTRIVRAATQKMLDRPYGDDAGMHRRQRSASIGPTGRSKSSTALSSLLRGLTVRK